MATCLQIITYAMRQCRILGPSGSPSTNETTEGMVALQSLYDQWRTSGMFGELEDVYLDENDTAEEGKRYYVPAGLTLTAATSAYIDSEGNTRQPRDLAMYESLSAGQVTPTAKLYDRTDWVDLIGLTSAGTAPLSNRNAYGLAACLACDGAFQAMFGAEPPNPHVMELAANFKRSIMGKRGSTRDRLASDYF